MHQKDYRDRTGAYVGAKTGRYHGGYCWRVFKAGAAGVRLGMGLNVCWLSLVGLVLYGPH